MKTKLYSYLILFLAAAFILACDDDNDSKPQPAAGFTASKTEGVKIGEEIQFTNNSENATAFRWSFGDGTTSKEVSPKKTYTSAGTFVVSLLSTGAGGSTISNVSITVVPDPEIFFSEYNAGFIRRLAVDGSGKMKDFLDVNGKGGVGLAYDATHGKIYFSDFDVDGEGKIWRVNLDGSELTPIVTGLYSPYQIALDVEGGKIYWGDDWDADDLGHIGRANLDGSGAENIVTIDGGRPIAIALDLKNDKLYYTDIQNDEINRVNLDGSGTEPILSGVYGYALFVDTKHDKLYFDEQYEEVLNRADLNGDNVEVVDDASTRIYGITMDTENDVLYWGGRDTGEIYKANLDGSAKVVVKDGLSDPRGIFFKK